MAPRVLPFRHAATAKGDTRPPVRILIVDDEAEMRQYVDRIMRDAGYETVVAADGEQAIAMSARLPAFDLMITDEMMPRIAGHQLARYMRERYLDIKVLYLTGFRDVLFREKGSLWADEAFLDKPCTPDGLLQAVSMLLFGSLNKERPDQVDR
jgi:CheY-like chemotaxis protein